MTDHQNLFEDPLLLAVGPAFQPLLTIWTIPALLLFFVDFAVQPDYRRLSIRIQLLIRNLRSPRRLWLLFPALKLNFFLTRT